MPGGNPYTRPANRKERGAMSRQSARKAAIENIDRRREENIGSSDQWLKTDSDLDTMQDKIRFSDAYAADKDIISGMKDKESKRKADRYKYKNGGKVKGYKGGGCVMAGRGGSYKGMR
jgi:hypothetical protein